MTGSTRDNAPLQGVTPKWPKGRQKMVPPLCKLSVPELSQPLCSDVTCAVGMLSSREHCPQAFDLMFGGIPPSIAPLYLKVRCQEFGNNLGNLIFLDWDQSRHHSNASEFHSFPDRNLPTVFYPDSFPDTRSHDFTGIAHMSMEIVVPVQKFCLEKKMCIRSTENF